MLSRDPTRYEALASRLAHRDVYHRSDYNEIEARRLGGRALYAVAEREGAVLLVPLIERPIGATDARDGTLRDLTMGGGYPSPLHAGEPATVRRLFDALLDGLRARGYVSAFLRHNPFVGDSASLVGPTERIGTTVAVALDGGGERRRAAYRENHRRDLRKAARLGLEVEAKAFAEEDVDAFRALYTETMARLGAAPAYFLDRDYFRGLAVSARLDYRLVTARLDGVVLARALFSVSGHVAQYHLGCSSEGPHRGAASKAVIDAGAELAAAAGCRHLGLGGGVAGAEDELLGFKRGFGPEARDVHGSKIVLDGTRYAGLCEGVDGAAGPGPFPAYRRAGG